MNRTSLALFGATSIIWGSSFMFIRVAVAHLPPSTVVFGRTALGAALLVPLAIRSRAFRGLRLAASAEPAGTSAATAPTTSSQGQATPPPRSPTAP